MTSPGPLEPEQASETLGGGRELDPDAGLEDDLDAGIEVGFGPRLDSVDDFAGLRPSFFDLVTGGPPPLTLQESPAEIRRPGFPAGESSDSRPIAAAPGSAGGTIGPYRLERELGRGGQGRVYLAEDTRLGRKVALKVLPADLTRPQVIRLRFEREAAALSRLDHPGICTVYDTGEEGGAAYIAMRYIDGKSLASVIAEETSGEEAGRGAADPRERIGRMLSLIEKAARALHAAHEAGIVHRDVKPGNIMVTRGGDPVVVDFGLAHDERGAVTLTQSGDLMGTPVYMSPEQVSSQHELIDRRTDVYSLGVTLFEAVTLKQPFEAPTPHAVFRKVLSDPPPSPTRFNRFVPRDLTTILEVAMEKDRAGRYRTALDFAEDLSRLQRNRTILARRASRLERAWRWCRRNPVVAGLSAATLGLLVALVAGAVVAAASYKVQYEDAQAARGKAEAAERASSAELYRSYVARAHYGRLTGEAGQVFEGLEAVRKAIALAGRENLSEEQLLELRKEAIACLATPDLRVSEERELPVSPVHVGGVSFDPRLERYTYADESFRVVICRMADHAKVADLPPPKEVNAWFVGTEFSPDGRFLSIVYVSSPDRLVVWDLSGPARVLEKPVWGAAFHPHRQEVMVAAEGGTMSVLSLPDGTEVARLASGLKRPMGLRFDPTGSTLAAFRGRDLFLLDARTGARRLAVDHPRGILSTAWSADGRWIAVVGWDYRVSVYNAADGGHYRTLSGHTGSVHGVDFLPQGNLLASRAWDATTRLWDVVAGREVLVASANWMRSSALGHLAAFLNNRTIGLWDATDGGVCRTLGSPTGLVPERWHKMLDVQEVDFSPDGRWLAASDYDGVGLSNAASGRQVAELKMGAVNSLRFDPRGGGLFTYGIHGLHYWPFHPDPPGGAVWTLGPPRVLLAASQSPDEFQKLAVDGKRNRLAYSQHQMGRAVLRDLSSPEHETLLATPPRTLMIALSGDGRWAAAASWGEVCARVWETSGGQIVATLCPDKAAGDEAFTSAAFSPDSQWLLLGTGRRYQFVKVGSWEVARFVLRKQLEPGLAQLAFSPRGQLAALTYEPSTVLLLDSLAGRELATLTPPDPTRITWLAFSPDGSQLAAATTRHVVHIWDLRRLRRELRELQLDWEGEAYPEPEEPPEGEALQVTVLEAETPMRHSLHELIEPTRKRIEEIKTQLAGADETLRARLMGAIEGLRDQYLVRGILEGGDLEKLIEPDKSAWEALVAEMRRLEELLE